METKGKKIKKYYSKIELTFQPWVDNWLFTDIGNETGTYQNRRKLKTSL